MPATQAGDGMQSGQQPLALKASSISSRLGWLGSDARLIVAARVLRSFAQGSVTVVVAIYLGLRGFSLVEIGLFLTLGSAGATVSAIVVGLVGDTFGRRRALIVLSILMTLTGITLAINDHFVVLGAAAFLGSFGALAGGGGGLGTVEQSILAISAPPQKRTDLERIAARYLSSEVVVDGPRQTRTGHQQRAWLEVERFCGFPREKQRADRDGSHAERNTSRDMLPEHDSGEDRRKNTFDIE